MQLVERTDRVEVPKATGVEGFLRVMREILQLSRVQSFQGNARGEITFTRLVPPEGPAQALGIELDSLMPYAVIRNGQVRELAVPQDNAAAAIALLFRQAALDRLYPVAFVSGPRTRFWDWYKTTTGIELPDTEEVYGQPFLFDRYIEDSTMVLCASSARGASLVDTERSYKIIMPEK